MRSRPFLLLPLLGALLLLSGFALWRFGPSIDLGLMAEMRLDRHSLLAPPVLVLTMLGGAAALIPLALAIVAWLLLRGRVARAVWLFATIGIGRLIVELLKWWFERERPPAFDRLAFVTSHSFPSSHSAGTMLTGLALAMLAPRKHRSSALLLVGSCAALIGWSRIALGVHWPSDVIAGFGLAMLWVGLAGYRLPATPQFLPGTGRGTA